MQSGGLGVGGGVTAGEWNEESRFGKSGLGIRIVSQGLSATKLDRTRTHSRLKTRLRGYWFVFGWVLVPLSLPTDSASDCGRRLESNSRFWRGGCGGHQMKPVTSDLKRR